MKYTQLTASQAVAFSPGRRLSSTATAEGTRTEDSFIENGRKCTGYTVNEGKKYCKQPFKEQDGSPGCKEWDTIYKGSVCQEWGEEKVKITVNSVDHSEMTNPEYTKVQEELYKNEETMDKYKNIYDSLEVSKKVEVRNLEHTLEQKWTEVEREWVTKQSEILRQKQAELTESQELQLTKMQSDYHKGI